MRPRYGVAAILQPRYLLRTYDSDDSMNGEYEHDIDNDEQDDNYENMDKEENVMEIDSGDPAC